MKVGATDTELTDFQDGFETLLDFSFGFYNYCLIPN